MRKVVDSILAGKFEYDNGSISLSESRIELTVHPGDIAEGSFVIQGDPGRYTEGYLYSSDYRMSLSQEKFTGVGESIGYSFSAEGMDEGDVLSGVITIVSNQGESKLPFSVMVAYTTINSSIGHIRNLFHFTNLAKSDFHEAASVFYDPAFPRILTGVDAQYLELYKGLSTRYGDEESVEEFLVGIHKKQKATYIIDEDRIQISDPVTDAQYRLIITKNGWGYTHLEIETEGDFLWVEKTLLQEEDFAGNRGEVIFQIITKRLHTGRNIGKLRFREGDQVIELPVVVGMKVENRPMPEQRRNRKRNIADLLRHFLAYRTRQMDRATWRTASAGILSAMTKEDEQDPLPKLYTVQLRITENKANEAGWLLDQARINILQSDDRDPSLWCYYLYLTTLLRGEPDYVEQVAAEVESYYQKDPENWKLGWFLLFLSGELNSSMSKRWMFLRRLLEQGCTSPLIYVECWLMLQSEPSLLMEVSECEARVLLFAARYELMTQEVIEQLHYLLPRSPISVSRKLDILYAAFGTSGDDTTLTDICSLLISEDRKDEKSFLWYERGVERNLRINKLYEYYMYALDIREERELPQVLFMYFGYDNMLDARHTAYMYANLFKRRNELAQIYADHKDSISKFVLDQLRKGRIDENLAYLYQEFLSVSNLDEELRSKLALLIFAKKLETTKENAVAAVVCQPWMEKEKIYPIVDKETVIICFEENVTILLEDERGRRFVPEGNEITVTAFFKKNSLERELAQTDFTSLGLQLHQCNPRQEEVVIRSDNAERYRVIATSDNVETKMREQVKLRLLQWDEKNGWTDSSEEILNSCNPELEDADGRKTLLSLYASRGRLREAVDMIRKYGYQKIDPATIYKIAAKWIENNKMPEPFAAPKNKQKTIEIVGGGIGDTQPLSTVETLARDPMMPGLFEQTFLTPEEPEEDPDKTQPLPDLERALRSKTPKEPLLLYLCHEAFMKGQFDHETLQYLLDHFDGPTRELRDIWKEALGDLPSVAQISEKLIIQMLYTGFFVGEKMAIFASYMNEKPDPDVKKAFLDQCAYDYFVKEKLTEEELMRYFEHEMEDGTETDLICKLAYAKYYGEHPAALKKKDTAILETVMRDLILQEIYLPCFAAFLELFDFLEEYRDKTVIEYKAHPSSVVQIRYVIGHGTDNGEDYHVRNMKDIYGGVCTAEFVLFFGEKLMYYITEEKDNVQELTESGTISHSEMHSKSENSRFGLLNDIMISETLQDYDTMNDMMDEYIRTDYLQENLFTL